MRFSSVLTALLTIRAAVKFGAMKRKFWIGAVAIICVAGTVVWPSIAQYKENARRRAAMDIPQSQRELRVPTSQQLDALLPRGARQILEQSPRLMLFSVKPRENYEPNKTVFHRHEILGQTVISDADEKRELLASLYDGFAPAPNGGMKFGCFNPRHGIRATHNGKTVDLLICFRCHQFNGYLNDHQFANYEFITDAPAPKFNAVLAAANIPVAR